MSSSKELTCKGTLRQMFIWLMPRTPLPRLHTVYVYYIQSQGRAEIEPERRLEGQHFTKLDRKYQHDYDCI
jgi:hypothetical protein